MESRITKIDQYTQTIQDIIDDMYDVVDKVPKAFLLPLVSGHFSFMLHSKEVYIVYKNEVLIPKKARFVGDRSSNTLPYCGLGRLATIEYVSEFKKDLRQYIIKFLKFTKVVNYSEKVTKEQYSDFILRGIQNFLTEEYKTPSGDSIMYRGVRYMIIPSYTETSYPLVLPRFISEIDTAIFMDVTDILGLIDAKMTKIFIEMLERAKMENAYAC